MYSSALPFSQHTYPAPQPVPVPTPVYYPVYQPVYQQPVYQNLQVSCYANISSAYTGSQVIWNASVSGGNGSYSYSWTGTDGLYGYNSSSVSKYYYTSGYKYATVTVTSGSQSVTQSCSNGIQIYDIQYYYGGNQQTYNYAYPVTYNNTQDQNNLDIGCFADPMNSTVNQPVTWSAEVTGGIAPYTYSWS
ncbi:MAG: hypothetical protein NTZ38_00920, partial [Candidatus Taylorbacteria bacterium]|nr:hypothetical protein [Candidatus Taylorbacteria bacterium]